MVNQDAGPNYFVLDAMDDWVRVVNREGITIFANRKMREDLGVDFLGKPCMAAFPDVKRDTICVTQKSMESGETVQKEQRIGRRMYSIKASPIYENNGSISGAVEVYRDLSREIGLEAELVRKNEKLTREIRFAKKVQEKLLPHRREYGMLTVDYLYRASETLSGDIFDIFNIDSKNTGIYIADVVGHGVAAAMMTTFVRQAMRSYKEYNIRPSEVLQNLYLGFNRLGLEPDKYFTVFYAVFNSQENTLTYANAGHNCIPLIISDHGIRRLEISGMPIFSLFDKMEYDEAQVPFEKGEKLFLYTDGLIENRDRYGEALGEEGLLELIEGERDNILPAIQELIKWHGWSEHDDDFAAVVAEHR